MISANAMPVWTGIALMYLWDASRRFVSFHLDVGAADDLAPFRDVGSMDLTQCLR